MNKVYACSDLHGQYELWEQISNYCDKTDKIYFLGDAIDRGPDGIKLFEALKSDPRVIYLKGNHEDLLIKSILAILDDEDDFYGNSHLQLWLYNGGLSTYEKLMSYPIETRKSYITYLNKLPMFARYKNKKNKMIYMTHSGSFSDPIWDRQHLIQLTFTEDINSYIVHGHTPVQKLNRFFYGDIKNSEGKLFPRVIKDAEVAFYCGGNKIDIDLGSFASNKTALLNLDTFEPMYFTMPSSKE